MISREAYIERANSIHGDIYDYSNSQFKGMQETINVFCKLCEKEWSPYAWIHAKPDGTGSKCKWCSGYGRTIDDFINAANKVHNNKYTYERIKRYKASSSLRAFCGKHNRAFKVRWYNHVIKGHGCRACGQEKRYNIKVEDVIKKFEQIHGEKYDYSLYTEWKGWHKTFPLICKSKEHPEHIFYSTPASHFYQQTGCALCGNLSTAAKMTSTTEEFVAKARIIHGGIFNYSKTTYGKNHRQNITIICSAHGKFQQRPDHHLAGSGCNECKSDEASARLSYDFKKFEALANEEHLGRYSYDEKSYTTYKDLKGIRVTCPDHGSWTCQPQNHTHGRGCPKCYQSHGEREVEKFLLNKRIAFSNQKSFPGCRDKRELRFDFYLPKYSALIEYDGSQHYIERDEGPFKGQFKEIKRKDKIKNIFCKEAGIPLLRIRYDDDIASSIDDFLIALN